VKGRSDRLPKVAWKIDSDGGSFVGRYAAGLLEGAEEREESLTAPDLVP
jgi:hypothetical protein